MKHDQHEKHGNRQILLWGNMHNTLCYLDELRESLIDEDEGDEESKNLLGKG